MTNPNGWFEKHVQLELKRLNNNDETIMKLVGNLREDVSTLRAKAGVWGLIAGIISSPIVTIIVIKIFM